MSPTLLGCPGTKFPQKDITDRQLPVSRWRYVFPLSSAPDRSMKHFISTKAQHAIFYRDCESVNFMLMQYFVVQDTFGMLVNSDVVNLIIF